MTVIVFAVGERAVADDDVEGVGARPLSFGRRPGEDAVRVDGRPGRTAAAQAEGQRVGGQVGVGRGGGEGEQAALVDGLVADGAQDRSDVDFGDGDGDRLAVGSSAPSHDAHIEGVAARPLRFGRRPGEDAGRSVDGRAGRTRRLRLKVSVLAGRSASVAVAVKVSSRALRRWTCRRWRPSTGATLTSLTVTVIVSVSVEWRRR